jgi:predicted DNA-binding protein (MmcQ/YjbR family)
MASAKGDRRLTKLTGICLALPEATRQIMGRHAGFYIRKKTLAYFLDDDHDDDVVGIACKVLPYDNKLLVTSNPAKFYMPAYVASKGWIGLRLDVGEIDWEKVQELVTHSHQLMAPRRLAVTLGADG